MFRITPIGSCRIYGPLRECAKEYGFKLNLDRALGYSHSSAEAVQQMRALSPEFQLNDQIWPLVASKANFNNFRTKSHTKSDLYIVELSSAKVITIGDTYIQLNYLNAYFRDFFSDTQRSTRFTQLCLKNNASEIEGFLYENWHTTPEQKNDTEILKNIRMRMSTEQSLYDDICLLKKGLENVIFVTHVNAKTAQNLPIPSREKYINLVTSAANRAGATLYNPTILMEKLGQQYAIEDNSSSYAHFTKKFSAQIFSDWYDRHFLDVFEELLLVAPEKTIKEILVPHAHGILRLGNSAQIENFAELLDAIEGYYPTNTIVKQIQQTIAGEVVPEF